MITNHGKGNPELVNLPRKINIGLATTRDDFAHTHINDVGLYAAKDPETGKVQCPSPQASSSSIGLRLSLVHNDGSGVNLHKSCMPFLIPRLASYGGPTPLPHSPPSPPSNHTQSRDVTLHLPFVTNLCAF